MPDLGLEVLMKGNNLGRLLGGLWIAVEISLLSITISIPLGILLGILMTRKNRLIPVSINLITRMIKTTSLILMIGVVEVLKVGQQIIEANRMSSPNAAFGVFLVIFILYFVICWSVSMTARYLERKWS